MCLQLNLPLVITGCRLSTTDSFHQRAGAMTDRRTIPLSALRAFESAGDHLHFGKAGAELGVTHGAISHQIRSLEEHLKVQLFSRAHNRLALTPAGQQLLIAVKEGFDRILDGMRHLDPGGLSGSLVIACTETIASSWAARHICDFHKQYPTVTITVRQILSRQKTIPRDIDIAICYGAPDQDDRRIIELGKPPLYPVCSPVLLQKREGEGGVEDIENFTLIHDQQVSWKKWCQNYSINSEEALSNITFPTTIQALRAASFGHGIALSNTLETRQLMNDGMLVRFLNRPIGEEESYYILAPSEQNRTSKTDMFEEWIINIFKEDME
jgi:LysR family glycine cleavage system transcriptional activator